MKQNKKQIGLVALFIVIGFISIFAFWWNVQASDFDWSRLDIYTDHHHDPPTPILNINHSVGQAGSYFVVTGSDYPALNTAVIHFNGQLMGTQPIDASGNFIFQFSTTNASNGHYNISVAAAVDKATSSDIVMADPTANVRFTLDPTSPNIWPQDEGMTLLFDVPTGIATFNYHFPIMFSSD